MTNLQAAVGLAQLERLDEFVTRKRRMGARYTELLSGVPGIELPLQRTDYAENIYWVYGLVTDDSKDIGAERAIGELAARGVGCRAFFCPMDQQPALRNFGLFRGVAYPEADRLYRQGFYIPSGLAMIDEQVDRVVECVKDVMR